MTKIITWRQLLKLLNDISPTSATMYRKRKGLFGFTEYSSVGKVRKEGGIIYVRYQEHINKFSKPKDFHNFLNTENINEIIIVDKKKGYFKYIVKR